MRFDRFLVENKYFSSREKAITAIKDGKVLVNKKVINKPSFDIKEEVIIKIINDEHTFVSRGGKKLEHAIKCFHLDFCNKNILDIGSSTGGFTDCSLQYGAKLVCAIDVGTDQMVKSLANNPLVKLKENFNLRDLKRTTFNETFDFIVTDVSFISLKYVFPVVNDLSNEKTIFLALIKPQFETENQFINSNGVIKDKKVHLMVINKVINYAIENNFYLNNLTFSPIKGKKEGNIEFLALFSRFSNDITLNVEDIVNEAHANLKE